MQPELILLVLTATLSLGLNVFLLIRKPKAGRQISTDARQILHDLTRHGSAVVEIRAINPENLILRSPRS